MNNSVWKWGLLIGGAQVAWLWAGGWTGLHGRGLVVAQVALAAGYAVLLGGLALALRALFRQEPETTFAEGLRAGGVMAVLAACVAAAGHAGYVKWIHPGWPAFVAGEARRRSMEDGATPEQAESLAAEVERAFAASPAALQAGVGTLIAGLLFSLAAAAVLRRLATR